jgi:cytochrome c oxidase assembly protein subunit 15
VHDLPADYKEQFARHRAEKNEKFARLLRGVGFSRSADRIVNDPAILIEADFNPIKTWIEYVNRLIGVAIGLLIIAVLIGSWRLRKTNGSLFVAALVTFILVLFQGWFGSIVVSTNLTGWTISVHMFLALVIVLLLTWLVHASSPHRQTPLAGSEVRPWILAAMALLLIQTFFGTEVRTAIDRVAGGRMRSEWVGALGWQFLVHRSFSWALLAVNGYVAWRLLKSNPGNRLVVAVIVVILTGFLSGLGLAYAGMPAWLQPVHLLAAAAALALQFLVWLWLNTTAVNLLRK